MTDTVSYPATGTVARAMLDALVALEARETQRLETQHPMANFERRQALRSAIACARAAYEDFNR